MIDIRHPLNIGTLAAWLSVSGFGVVGMLVPMPEPPPRKAERVSEVQFTHEDFAVGENVVSPAEISASEPVSVPVPQPPQMPEMAEIEPLPPVPGFPALSPIVAPRPSTTAPMAGGASAVRAASGTRGGSSTASQGGEQSRGSGASGMSNNARIAAGRMPSPAYPPYSRRNLQQGTVVVEFTVDQNGKVISAYAKKPSPWPLLNQEAVSTVRLWRFPPGGVMTLQRPIVFQIR